MSKITGIVLAAGRSARMAPDNKLVSPIGQEPMIRRAVASVLASDASPVIVVTGYEADRIVTALSGLDVTYANNADYPAGLSTSLRAGLQAVPAEADGALIFLGDMPWIDVSVIRALIAAFTGQDAICVPVHRGERGNPVLWGRSYFGEIMSLTGDSGAKPLMSRHAARLVEVNAATDGILRDIDVPADLASLNKPGRSR